MSALLGDPKLCENEDCFLQKDFAVRVVVWVTCSLSMVGAVLIILSYICVSRIRSKAREILLHISIMDFGVAFSNLVGSAVYFDKFYLHDCHGDIEQDPQLPCPVNQTVEYLCKAQAFFAIYCTVGSIFWTLCLSFYLYFLIVHHGTKRAKYTLYFSYFFCYLFPLLITLWLLFTGKLGYSPYNSSGWCGIIDIDPWTMERYLYVQLLGYDLWIYLTFLIVPVLSISAHLYIRDELKKSTPFYNSNRFWQALQNVDYKFLLIPVAFIVLRMWSCIVAILIEYAGKKPTEIPQGVSVALMILSGIGDSGQGITNAILFVLFTKKAREHLLCFCFHGDKEYHQGSAEFPHLQETKKLLQGQTKARPQHYVITQSIEKTPPLTK